MSHCSISVMGVATTSTGFAVLFRTKPESDRAVRASYLGAKNAISVNIGNFATSIFTLPARAARLLIFLTFSLN